ncbi:MAG TPA: hypothetical protein DHU55_14420 [Blastocatellia bacterium]|nr:hypothetical protein [Blastocatellia bacterium]
MQETEFRRQEKRKPLGEIIQNHESPVPRGTKTEGFKKKGRLDKVRFMNMAQGSLEECRYYLILTRDLRYADPLELFGQLEEVSKLLGSYSAAITASGS